jgi:peroxin-2
MSTVGIDSTRAVYVQRASQLEAERLDDEVLLLLLHQAYAIFRHFRSGFGEAFTPELRLILRGVFYANTVLTHESSPGRAIQNLRLCSKGDVDALMQGNAWLGNDGKRLSLGQRYALFTLEVILPYLWGRVRLLTRSSFDDSPMRWLGLSIPNLVLQRLLRVRGACETIHRALELANFAAFLSRGRYPKLSHRLTRTVMQYADIRATRTVSFEFVNRQLVWSGFAEFMVFLTPVLWSARTSRRLSGLLSRINLLGVGSNSSIDAESSSPQISENRIPSAAGEQNLACPRCESSSPCMAHIALPCRHVFCYVCLALAMETDPGYKCKRCGVSVHAYQRLTAS